MFIFLLGSEVKASACNVGDLGSIPGLGRSPGEGNGNQLQYSCLENPMDRGAWWAILHRVAKSRTRLRDFTMSHCLDSVSSVQFSSVAQSCLTLCDPMNRSTPGLPVHHQLLEYTQTHVHRVGDAISPSVISSSVIPFSSCPQSFPASGSFQMSQFFASGGQSIGVSASASVLPMNIQD